MRSNNNNSNNTALDQMTIEQLTSGLKQASLVGATQLPSRDIPMQPYYVNQDEQSRANFIPKHTNAPNNYMGTDSFHPNDMIQNYNQQAQNKQRFEDIYEEIQIPLILAILFFIFQLPFFKTQILTFLPGLFDSDGKYNLQGYSFVSVLFGVLFYFIQKLNVYFGNR